MANRAQAAPLVLIADDEPEVCAFVEDLLQAEGLRTLTTQDPEAVLGLAAARRPALLIVDINMPRLDGYTLATHLRGTPATEHLPIIFITGAPERIYRTLSFGVGGVAHLEKPFTAKPAPRPRPSGGAPLMLGQPAGLRPAWEGLRRREGEAG